jgi:hypothetical protein
MSSRSTAMWRLRVRLGMVAVFLVAGVALQLLQMLHFLHAG